MPHSDIQWLMFLFFAIGALGGVLYLVQLGYECVQAILVARHKSRLE